MSSAKYVIVGGGVYGCALAFELSSRGEEVLLLEAGSIADGASGGPGKRGIRANGRDPRELPLMELAHRLWPELETELGISIGYEQTGSLRLFERETVGISGGTVSARARAWVQNRARIVTQWLDKDEVHRLEPEVGTEVLGALHCPLDGVASHSATTRAYAEAARRAGAEIKEHTSASTIVRDENGVEAVLTEQGERIEVGQRLFLLSNLHSATLISKQLGIELPVWPVLPQVLFAEPDEEIKIHHLIGHDSRSLAMKQGPQGGLMISGGWRGGWDSTASKGQTIPEQVEGNLAEAVEVFPRLGGARVREANAERAESCCIDGVPVIDRLPGAENTTIATGWSGHGFAIAPAVCQLLAQWEMEGARPKQLSPFSYARFG